MSIEKVEVNLYNGMYLSDEKLVVKEFAGRMVLIIKNKDGEEQNRVECYKEDINRAWDAVKK